MRLALLLSVLVAASALLSAFPRTTSAVGEPTADFDWSMADRFGLDENSDGVIDYFPGTSDLPGLTGDITPGTFTVRLDACDSTADSSIVSYAWNIAGTAVVPSASCTSTRQLEEGTYPVTLTVVDAEGDIGTLTRDVVVQDWLIVALGDSYGSGEGNPDLPVPLFLFDDLEDAQQAAADAQDDYDAALLALGTLDTDYDETVEAMAAVAVPCGWSDTNDNGLYDTWDALAVNLIDCPIALANAAFAALEDSLDLLGEAMNDAIKVAQEALDLAQADFDLAVANVTLTATQLLDFENSLSATWQYRRCHRSARAGIAQAALELERQDPRTSVTFVHLACSGAEADAGLLNPYKGAELPIADSLLDCDADPGQCIPPQIKRADQLVGDREVDALFMSIGGNDANFGSIIQACIVLEPCHVPPATPDPLVVTGTVGICLGLLGPVLAPYCTDFLDDLAVEHGAGGQTAAEFFADGLAELAPQDDGDGLYQRVDQRIADRFPDLTDDRVYISEYPNATEDDDGTHCPDVDPLKNLPGMTLAEGTWADNTVTQGLDDMVRLNAIGDGDYPGEGWNLVDGVYDAFATHGYCADDHWFVRVDETFRNQFNHVGMVHPNGKGQHAYRDLILPKIREDLYVGGDVANPRRPAQPPVAEAGGPYFVDEGSSVVLDGTGSYSPDLDPFDYLWAPKSFVVTGSTLTGNLTSTPVFHAADDGIESVTLEVTDDDGTGSDSALVYIENLPPVVAVGADGSVLEGSSFSRSGSFTDPSARDTHTATVNYGDGTGVQALPLTPARTFALSHVYADNGIYAVVVCVTDDDGGGDCAGLSVTVLNAAPVASGGNDRSTTEGAVVSLAPATFSDQGTLDTHTATVDWGDGTGPAAATVSESPFGPPGSSSGAAGSVSASHVYADNGVYTVLVCVTDDDGDADCDSLAVTAGNAAAVVNAGADRTVNEGATVALAPATFNDPGTLDTHIATVDWGDGSAPASAAVTEAPFGPPGLASGASGTVAASHAYGDNGAFTVTVCVTDDDGSTACDGLTITVLNVPPSVTIAQFAQGAPFVLALVPVSALVSFTDPGVLDTHTATVNWGDGSPVEALGGVNSPFAPVHAFSSPGIYTVIVTVIDDDGGIDAESVTIEVVSPLDALGRVSSSLGALATDPGTNAAARVFIQCAIADLGGNNGGSSNNGAFTLLAAKQYGAAVEKMEQAIYCLDSAAAADSDLDLGQFRLVLAWAGKSVALDIVARAEVVATSSGQLKAVREARRLITEGDALLAAGGYAAATDKYQKAIGKVEKLLP
ncbi:MAG: hypothetical protein HY874_05555 [Chloroflexi bacterium]|nr:hypothetical protein [Chloroflexota bacterium]